MRLIDADKAQEEFCGRCAFKSDGGCSKCRFYGFIDRQPTVEPVKHGHWMDGGRNYNTWWHKCSCCYANFTDLRVMTYCPACGAKMDEKLEK